VQDLRTRDVPGAASCAGVIRARVSASTQVRSTYTETLPQAMAQMRRSVVLRTDRFARLRSERLASSEHT